MLRILMSLAVPELFISIASAACADYFSPLLSADTNPSLLIVSDATTYQCVYNVDSVSGAPPAVGSCDLTCPVNSQVVVVYPAISQQVYLASAHFDSIKWTGQQTSPSAVLELGTNVQFACSIRCVSYVDGDGTQHRTRCNTADAAATCSEDRSQPLCSCSPGYTGQYCGVPIAMYTTISQWLGPADTTTMLDIIAVAQRSPAALVAVLPYIYAMFPTDQLKYWGFSLNEIVDSIDFDQGEVDLDAAFIPVTDEQLGNCYTFNYGNRTDNDDGLYRAHFSGQHRDLTITLKLHPSENVAWIDCDAISTYIHAPGTPPRQASIGVLYSVRGAAADLLALRKTITKLNYGCISSTDKLKQSYYEDGSYTADGCYSACYQDKVLEKCGCMDARMKKAPTASQCLFKDKACVDAVTTILGDPTSWSWCKCPTECYQEAYALTATRASLPYKLANCANATDGCSDLNESIARLTVYLESLESEIYVEFEKMPFLTMLSQMGGQLGFLLGMSVVGILEILILCATLGKDVCCFKSR